MVSLTANVCTGVGSGTDHDVTLKFSTVENGREVRCATKVLDESGIIDIYDDWESRSNKTWGQPWLGNCTKPFRPIEGLKGKIYLTGDSFWDPSDEFDDFLLICGVTVSFGSTNRPNVGWSQTWGWKGRKSVSRNDGKSENWFEMQRI